VLCCSYKNKFPVRTRNPLMIKLVNVEGKNNVQDKGV